jgi:hypothetical protein
LADTKTFDPKRLADKIAELKGKHSDWDATKLEKTAKMQLGREDSDAKTKAEKLARETKIADVIKSKNPNINDSDLAKEIKDTIAKEDHDAKVKKADDEVDVAYKALFSAIVARAKLDTKAVELPKDVQTAIDALKNSNL